MQWLVHVVLVFSFTVSFHPGLRLPVLPHILTRLMPAFDIITDLCFDPALMGE